MEEHAGKLWFGICAGRTVPSARLALAGTRITALDKTNTVMECFMDPSVAKNPDPVWAACHAMDMTLTGPRIPEDVVPSLPQAIWVEFPLAPRGILRLQLADRTQIHPSGTIEPVETRHANLPMESSRARRPIDCG